MSRQFKAFISYRHLPVDMATAELLHRRIERYRIPKALRTDGKARFGYVFRDRDELPLSTSLTGSIEEALDSSEFLIVVCTPDTPKSAWVRREIEYFLSHHDMDHVIAVHAAGTTAESFPDVLRYSYAEDGTTVLAEYEHLAADFTGRDSRDWKSKVNREILRVYAALLGCDFDALYRREQRYRARRRAAVFGGAAAVAMAFIGLLLNRNAVIREQLEISQINESKALVGLSQEALEEGDRFAALEYALDALPGPEADRPYIPAAEAALSDALNCYIARSQGKVFSIRQETQIRKLEMGPEGAALATSDNNDEIRLFDGEYGRLIWTRNNKDYGLDSLKNMRFIDGGEKLLLRGYGEAAILSAADGSVLWQAEDEAAAVSRDGSRLALCGADFSGEVHAAILDAADLTTAAEMTFQMPEGTMPSSVTRGAFSEDGRYLAVIVSSYVPGETEEDGTISADITVLFDLDRKTGRMVRQTEEPDLLGDSALTFTQTNDLVVIHTDSETVNIACHRRDLWTEKFSQTIENHTSGFANYIYWLDTSEEYICCGYGSLVTCVDAETGEIVSHIGLPGPLLAGNMFNRETGAAELMLDTGIITVWLPVGETGYTSMLDLGYYYDAGFRLNGGALLGDSYRTCQYAMIPTEHPETAVVVRYITDPNIVTWETGNEALDEDNYIFASPSGNTLAMLRFEYDGVTLDGAIVTAGEDYGFRNFSFETEEQPNFDMDDVTLTDDGRLTLRGWYLDPAAGTLTVMETPEDASSSDRFVSRITEEGDIVTAWLSSADGWSKDSLGSLYLWKNGADRQELTCPWPGTVYHSYDDRSRLVMGGGGLLLYDLFEEEEPIRTGFAVYRIGDGTWAFLENEGAPTGAVRVAAGEKKPIFAAADSAGDILIYDGAAEACVGRFPGGAPAEGIAHMMFIEEDELLLVFHRVGRLQIYRVSDGEKLGEVYHRDRNMAFYDSASYSVRDEGDGYLLLQYYTDVYRQGCLICLYKENWEESLFAIGVRCFVPATGDYVMFDTDLPGFRTCRRYTLEDMIDWGNGLLAARSGGSQEETEPGPETARPTTESET